jgi:hypothetical protein
MNRSIGIIIMGWLLLLSFSTVVRAENDKAKITADEVNYDYETQQVEAIGNVKIEYRDIKVESDHAIIDQEQDVLLATGNLAVTNKNSTYHGDRFLYYLNTERGWISPLEAEVTDLDIQGPAYLTAAEANIKGEEIRSKHSTFSTCNLAHPHYHLSAKAIDYYPGDVIIMHHVWYWEHSIPLFYFPLLYISLKKDNFAVQFGQSSTEGWFVDTKYYFYHFPDDEGWGNLHLRLTEYGGTLYEVDGSHPTSPTGTFTQKYAVLEKSNMTNSAVSGYTRDDGAVYEPNYDDYMLGFSYKENLNPKVATSQSIERWFHYNEDGELFQNTTYNLTVSGQSPYPSLNLAFEDKGEDVYRTVNLSSNWNFNPDRTSSVALNGQWYYQGYVDENNPYLSRQYTLNARKDWGWSNVAMTVSENRNYNNTNSSGTNLLPNIIYTVPEWKIPLINDIKMVAQYTKLEKYSSTVSSEGERYALDLSKPSLALWNKGQFTIENESSFKYRDFLVSELESELYSVSSQLGLKDQFTKAFYTKLDIGYAETYGTTNSYFGYNGDDDLPGLYAENNWDYSDVTFRAHVYTKYNFQTQYAYPLTITAGWFPVSKASLNFDTIYYWGDGPGQTDFSVNYNPDDSCKLSLILGYNFQEKNSPWTNQQFMLALAKKISSNWSYNLAATYNYLKNDFSVAQGNLIYDWHCRQVVFHYDEVEKEFWLQFVIKAFPNSSLKFTANNTVQNLLDGIQTE